MKLEVADNKIKTFALDHHGLVAGICQDLNLAGKIDERLGKKDPRRIVSAGMGAVAMIVNGLGFTNRRLYLTPQFFESKPVSDLFGKSLAAKDFNDHALGKALDEISAYGSSKLFGEIAFEIALENNLLGELAHIDSTSLSVEGKYDVESVEETVVKLTYGHSKDHRADLKQVVMSLVVSGKGSIPIWMEPKDGNSSDKTSFHETIKKVRAFQKQLKGSPEFKWVADSALYNKEKLLSQSDYLWLSRVPETVREAREIVEMPDSNIDWVEEEKGYKISSFSSMYGDIKQRWLLVYSQQGYERERKTLMKKLDKQETQLRKSLHQLGSEKFSCEVDARKAVERIAKQFSYYTINTSINTIAQYGKPGRPKKDADAEEIIYRVTCDIERNQHTIDIFLNRKGRFILATNDLDETKFTDKAMLSEYKQQQCIEQGFRFLKDPWFMVDSIFLKSPKRIEALMMIMTLCLMVYNIGQYRLRCALKKNNETLPNQVNKPIQNPTLRWIFQIMEGIGVTYLFEKTTQDPAKKLVTNVDDLRIKILRLFGGNVQKKYGLA